MAANDRNNPTRRTSSSSDYSLMELMREFPDDSACLDRLWRDRFAPDGQTAHCTRCDKTRRFHRTKTRASYTCDSCGLHVHPMAGTIFEKSTTSLHLWFYGIYLIASTRCGISAKQLERELGVTYKTAHRMMKKIRTEVMNDLEARYARHLQARLPALQSYLDEYSWRYSQHHSRDANVPGVAAPQRAERDAPTPLEAHDEGRTAFLRGRRSWDRVYRWRRGFRPA